MGKGRAASTRGRCRCRQHRRPRLRRRRRRRRPHLPLHARRTCGEACSTRGATSPPRPSVPTILTSRNPTPPPFTTGCTAVRQGATTAEWTFVRRKTLDWMYISSRYRVLSFVFAGFCGYLMVFILLF